MESFFSSDLSVLNNQPQTCYHAPSFEGYFGINMPGIPGTNSEKMLISTGLGLIANMLQPTNNEDISLVALGLYFDYYYPFNEKFGAKTSLGFYWRYYSNQFTIEQKDFEYKKHGFMMPFLAGVYFEPFKGYFIEANIKYNMSTFRNNDKNIDGIASTLPKNSWLNSITPTIGIKAVLH